MQTLPREETLSSTVWARASKEWIIPAKPKPGRKPKKDLSNDLQDEPEQQGDGKARRTQNRAAQRAFRERKQSHLAELQARIQMYEQGEVERNVALQNLARRLKEENESLRKENSILQEKVTNLEAELCSSEHVGWKRGRSADDHHIRKRSRITMDSTNNSSGSSRYFSSSSVSTPDLTESPHSPLSLQGPREDMLLSQPTDFDPSRKSKPLYGQDASSPIIDCGFCDITMPCVCREVALQQAAEGQTFPNSLSVKLETMSTAENLPPYQPPVPLRRSLARRNHAPIFPVFELPSASCSGDPSNCVACSADDFGKAFCEAVNSTASTPCDFCHSIETGASETIRGNRQPLAQLLPPTPSANSNSNSSAMISCDDAWRQLKKHPNVEFSDLSLLADVVAQRSKCMGPTVVLTPVPDSIASERTDTAGNRLPFQVPGDSNADHAFLRDRSSPPKLVSQEELTRCSREQRIRRVPADAVQAALRLLDAKSTFYKS